MIRSPLSCFLPDKLPNGVLPVYRYSPEQIPVIADNGKIKHYWSNNDHHSFVIPIQVQTVNLEDIAWKILLNASLMNLKINYDDLNSYFCGNTFDFVIKDNTMLAVLPPEYLARRPYRGNEEGLGIYNTSQVVRVNADENEICLIEVMQQ